METESASQVRSAPDFALTTAPFCSIVFHPYLAGGTLSRKMEHRVFHSPYLKWNMAVQNGTGVFHRMRCWMSERTLVSTLSRSLRDETG